MKIVKYKKVSGSKYEVELENSEKIKLYEDVILKESLLITKEIDDIEEIQEKNKKYEIYDVALRYLSHHVMSIKGMKDYLLKKGYDEVDIDKNINKLINSGYLNDSYYAKCYIQDKINLSNDGPKKIVKHLMDMDISYDVYREYINSDNAFWIKRITKEIDKQLKVNKKSAYAFKNKMLVNLVNLGYEREMINECLSSINISNEKELYEKEEAKIRTKLEKKYSGSELERKIKEKLYMKGFINF